VAATAALAGALQTGALFAPARLAPDAARLDPIAGLGGLVSRVWASHVELNLWSLVPEGFVGAIAELRGAGVKTAIVSNSEGMLDRLFSQLGLGGCFDALVDSGRVGCEKPGKEIFEIACARTGTTPAAALHLGDTYATDVLGAWSAGMRTALIDPYAHYEGLYPEVARVPGVVEVARALVAARLSR
jgi:putative hydrolase of the HAD superfamily